tara:strand:+ start:1152 stop:1604 length:453 start_codon:yes stop_codon:yes gene_type:complete
MIMPRNILLLNIILYSFSCNIIPKGINYGHDECYHCKMLIVDKKHGGKIVTSKGKTYKFDSIECMIGFVADFEKFPIQKVSVIDYNDPGVLIDANQATFLKSKNIPSPMGAFLSAIKDRKVATEIKNIKGGVFFTWSKLLEHNNANHIFD